MAASKIPETLIGGAAVAWLKAHGYKVWQEVSLGRGTSCDIVARLGKKTIALECKVHLNISVILQAYRWKSWSHSVYVVVPAKELSRHEWLMFKDMGIGLILVYMRKGIVTNVEEVVAPRLERKALYEKWDRYLRDEDADACRAGSQSGRITPFQATMRALTIWVHDNPGHTCREALRGIRHHYKSEKSALSQTMRLIRDGVYKNIKVEKSKDGKSWVLAFVR